MARQQFSNQCRPVTALRHGIPFFDDLVAMQCRQRGQPLCEQFRIIQKVGVFLEQQADTRRQRGLDDNTGRSADSFQ